MTKYELVKEFAPERFSEEKIKKIIGRSNKEQLEKIYNFWVNSEKTKEDRSLCWILASN